MKARELRRRLEVYLRFRYSNQTVSTYVRAIDRLIHHHSNAKRLKADGIMLYMADLKRKGHSVAYRTTTLCAIKAYYEFLVEVEIIKEHPCRGYYLSEKKPSGRSFKGLISMEDMERLLKLRKERYQNTAFKNKSIIGLLIYQGLTSHELISLKPEHIDLDEQKVYIPRNKKNRARTISLKPNQVHDLQMYMERERPKLLTGPKKVLFVNLRGDKLTTDSLHSFISSMQGACDEELTPKNIRNSVIHYWLNVKKIRVEDVQMMVGHRYPSSTEKHRRNDIVKQREELNAIHEQIFL